MARPLGRPFLALTKKEGAQDRPQSKKWPPMGRLPADLCPFDEKWSYTGKKQRHLTPQDDPVFGKGKLATVVQTLGWNQPNISAIERFNLTDRCRNRCKTRKTLAFSKRSEATTP